MIFNITNTDTDDRGPEDRPLIERQVPFTGNLRATQDQADEFADRLGPGHETDHDGDHGTDQPAPEGAEHILSHILGLGRERYVL